MTAGKSVRDIVAGLGGLLALALLAALALGIVTTVAYVFVGSGAWKPILGFLIAAVVIGSVSVGVRSGDRT